MAIGIAVLFGGVPASFAQDSRALDQSKGAGTDAEAKRPRTHQGLKSNKGISLEVPTGKISVVTVGPDAAGGEPVYVRRTSVRDGMTVVEVSTSPFMPELAPNQKVAALIIRPDQPAGW